MRKHENLLMKKFPTKRSLLVSISVYTRDTFHDLVLAGHETTSTLITWTMYNLANHPDIYHRCQAEVDSVLNTDEELTASTISLLTYTEAVLKETLRYHQPVAGILRTAIENNTIVASDGKQIRVRKGTDVAIQLNILHR